jgi:hypothetical protein
MQNAERWTHTKIESLLEKVNKTAKNPAVKGATSPAVAAKQRHGAANDGAGTSKQNGVKLPVNDIHRKVDERKLFAKIRAGLQFAGYPPNIIEELIGTSVNIPALKSKTGGVHWYLRLPNGRLVRSYKQIRENPYPGGVVAKNPLCEVSGCSRKFAHDGNCIINESMRAKDVKRKPEEHLEPSPHKEKAPRVTSPSMPSGSGLSKPTFVNGSSTSVVVECGSITGTWSPKNPSAFKVTHGLPAVKMPNGTIDGNVFERLGGKGHCKNWRFSIRVKLEDGYTMGVGTYMERIKNSGEKPIPQKALPVEWPVKEVEAAIAKKKEGLRLTLAQAHYPFAMIDELLKKTRFKSDTNAEGKLIIKFSVKLPSGSSVSTDEGILQNAYSLGGGIAGGMYALQGPGKGRRKEIVEDSGCDVDEVEEATNNNGGQCETTAPSGHIKEEPNEVPNEVKKADPQEEFVIYLATTEEEDNVEDEGEDYSSDDDQSLEEFGKAANKNGISDNSYNTMRERKIEAIRAALHRNGYPADVVEDLIQTRLRLNLRKDQRNYNFSWNMLLPNGKRICSYIDIDANPYQGGKIN